MITNRIEQSQKNVEANNFRLRKHVLQYDDVMNQQRTIIYGERKRLLNETDIKMQILDMIDTKVDAIVETVSEEFKTTQEWDDGAAIVELEKIFGIEFKPSEGPVDLKEDSIKKILEEYARREEVFGVDDLRNIERILLLRIVDEKWMEQIDAMDQLKTGIGLRSYGGQDPVLAYQIEGSQMFEAMNEDIRTELLTYLFHVEDPRKVEKKRVSKNMVEGGAAAGQKQVTVKRSVPKVGRNDLCPCGSGKKYKNCCGRNL